MPLITATAKTNNKNSSASNNITTASITPAANTLTILAFTARTSGSGVLPSVSSVVGCNLTWSLIGALTWGSNYRRIFVYKGVGASPSTGTIVVTFGQSDIQSNWNVIELANVNLNDPVVQTNTNTASAQSLTVTLGAFQSVMNATMGFFANEASAAGEQLVVGSGFTGGFGNTDLNGINLLSEFKNSNDTGVDATKNSPNRNLGGIAVEFRARLEVAKQVVFA